MMKKKMFKTASALFLALSMTALTGCSSLEVPDKYNYDLSEYIKLGQYKDLTYSKVETRVSDAEVEDYIYSAVQSAASTVDKEEGTVESDDVVKIDYEGSIGGEVFDGGSAEDYELDLGNSNFIDGFAEQIVGHEVGEDFDIQVTFPADYSNNEELAGKTATFAIHIDAIVETETPTYDDEFVKQNTDFDSKEEYEENVREQLQESKEAQAESAEMQDVFSQIVNNAEVLKLPDKEVDETYDSMISQQEALAEQSDTDLEKYVYSNYGVDLDEYKTAANQTAEDTVTKELILYALAQELDIRISDKDYNEYVEDMIESAGYTKDQFEQATGMSIEAYATQNNLYNTMLYEEVMDEVMKTCVAK